MTPFLHKFVSVHGPFPSISARMLVFGVAVAWCGVSAAQVPPPPMDPISFRAPDAAAQYEAIEIEQNLGAQVDLSLRFRDETGQERTLAEFMNGQPAILAMVYYECPMICNQVLKGAMNAVDAVGQKAGDEFVLLAVSIDPGETPELAAAKRANYIDAMAKPAAGAGIRYLTGAEPAIEAVADAVGFRYAYDANRDEYVHAAGVMVLTPEGVVSRYFYGIEYLGRDMEFALTEAADLRVGNLVDKLVLLCFQYDPHTNRYAFWIFGAMRTGAVLMIVGFLAFWGHHWWSSRRARAADGGVLSPGLPHETNG